MFGLKFYRRGTAAAFYVLLSGLTLLTAACGNTRKTAQTAKPEMNQEVTSLDGDPILLGPVNREGLMQTPHKEWFEGEYNEYKPDKVTLDHIRSELKDVDLLVFLGTWCEDSRREVPHFFKILDYIGSNSEKMDMISVDNHPDRYKESPGGETATWKIENVPTFILLKDGREIGRIVEYPEETLERDLAKILE